MTTVVDTSIWSLALRRRRDSLSPDERALVLEWRDLVAKGAAVLVGPVRQEVLTGIPDAATFEQVRWQLEGIPDLPLDTGDFVAAARDANTCRAAGIAGAPTDFLICAISQRRQLDIFTTDDDFPRYARVLPIRLHRPRAKP